MSVSINLLSLGYAAGALTILSPCVLPLVPIVLGSAAQRSRWGPLALAVGLVASFTTVALAVALAGVSGGGDILRVGGAVLLVLAGVGILFKQVGAALGRVLAPFTSWANDAQMRAERFGTLGQAAIGVLLGIVWSPCVGPTLGAATALASQGRDVGTAALTILAFGAGVSTTLMVVALAARGLFPRWRQRLMSVGGVGNRVFGMLLVVVGLLIITGLDHQFEALAVAVSPDWLTDLTTRF